MLRGWRRRSSRWAGTDPEGALGARSALVLTGQRLPLAGELGTVPAHRSLPNADRIVGRAAILAARGASASEARGNRVAARVLDT